MRVYFAATAADLATLRSGEGIHLPAFPPASDDELDEFEALSEAAAAGPVAVAADVATVDGAVRLTDVASFHVDVDGSGDLAWFATQELAQVLEHLTR